MIFTFDVDGTVTRYPDVFVALGTALRAAGHKVYLLTGLSSTGFTARQLKYDALADLSWVDGVWTADEYNDEERALVPQVKKKKLSNHELVAQFKARMCRERGVAMHFDDDEQVLMRFSMERHETAMMAVAP